MPLGLIKQFNWVDIFIIILLFRVCYISLKNGFAIALFKLSGTILAIYIALHYYTVLSDSLPKYFSIKKVPLEFFDFISFLLLALISYFLFVLIRNIFTHFIKMEAVSNLNKWGGLVLGVARGVLLCALLVYILFISSVNYLNSSAKRSHLGSWFFKVAPDTYSFLWNNIASKFMVKEKFNVIVTKTEEKFSGK